MLLQFQRSRSPITVLFVRVIYLCLVVALALSVSGCRPFTGQEMESAGNKPTKGKKNDEDEGTEVQP
jgi:hypothetical protein